MSRHTLATGEMIDTMWRNPRSAVSLIAEAHYWWSMALPLFLIDSCGLLLVFGSAVLFWIPPDNKIPISFYFAQWPALLVFPALFAIAGLYRIACVSPVALLRRAVLATNGGFLLLVFTTFMFKSTLQYSRGVFILSWAASLVLAPAVRLVAQSALGRRSWFAVPVAILGAGETGKMLMETLQRNPALALRPVVAFDDDPQKFGGFGGIRVAGPLDEAADYCARRHISYAILAIPRISRERLLGILDRTSQCFSRLLLVPDLSGVSSVWVEARDLSGVLGLEIRDNLARAGAAATKRALDLTLTILTLPFSVPLCLLMALLVKLTSRGPAFYLQERFGRQGSMIQVWKFRTMVEDSEAVLEKHLGLDPVLRAEWESQQKLKADPRITPIGRFLRRSSLDELPQLLNVLKGEMSLVGPRPIIPGELEKYGASFKQYTRVTPGITGPWQVSGRGKLTYAERVQLNEHYVRNWSIWLDLYILFRTIPVVLTLEGAY